MTSLTWFHVPALSLFLCLLKDEEQSRLTSALFLCWRETRTVCMCVCVCVCVCAVHLGRVRDEEWVCDKFFVSFPQESIYQPQNNSQEWSSQREKGKMMIKETYMCRYTYTLHFYPLQGYLVNVGTWYWPMHHGSTTLIQLAWNLRRNPIYVILYFMYKMQECYSSVCVRVCGI